MPIGNLFKVSQSAREKFCSHLIESSAPRIDFYFLVILSTLIVALGLVTDNIVLVIGGMLVTPLLSPILAVALGIVINHPKVIIRSVRILSTSFLLALVVAMVVGFFTKVQVSDIKIISIMQPSLFTLFIAFIAGMAASYTWVKPNVNETLPGIAITVTLIPPLTAVGLAVASRDWDVAVDTLLVLLLNILGIIITSIIVFSFMDFYKARQAVEKEIKQEEKEQAKKKKAVITSELKKVEAEKEQKIKQIEEKHKKKLKNVKEGLKEEQKKIKQEMQKVELEKKMLNVEKGEIEPEEKGEIKWKD